MARALVPLLGSRGATEQLEEVQKLAAKLETGEVSLTNVMGGCRAANPGKRILLIADQFEEVFTLVSTDDRRLRFIDALLTGFPEVGRNTPNSCLVLTLRADFFGKALQYRPLADALQGRVENLGPMTRVELRQAIELPAGFVSFESGLVDTLLDDVGNRPGSLPLLQFALREIWGRLDKYCMTRASYDAIGGVEGAVAKRAQAIYDALTAKGEDSHRVMLFRRLFTRLVTLGEGAEDTRRIVGREELGEEAWVLAQGLAGEDNRLVVTSAPTPNRETAEVVHEALIRHWPTLVEWVSRDRAFQSWLRQLKSRLDEWHRHPEDEGTLLRGSPLAMAQEWLGRRGDEVSAEEREFILESSKSAEASRQLELQRVQEVARLQAENEAQSARLRAEQETRELRERATATARRNRSRYITISAAFVVFATTLGFSLYKTTLETSQQSALATQNFNLAANSAKTLLDRLRASVDRGDITIKGASDMLAVAGNIVAQAHDVESTKETISLMIDLEFTASDIFAALGDKTLAYENANKAGQLAKQLLTTDANDPEALRFLYGSIWRMGDGISSRGLDEATQRQALAEYLEAEKLIRRLVELAPENGANQRELMFIQQRIGDVNQALNDIEPAVAEYNKSLTLIQDALARAPNDRRWRRDLANTRSRIGQTFSEKSDFAGALKEFGAALKIRTELAQEDPDDVIVSANLAAGHGSIAALYAREGDLDGALTEYETAILIQERLAARDPTNATSLFPLASLYAAMGDVLRKQGKLADALGQFRKAYEVRQQLARKDPRNPGPQNSLAMAEIALADVLGAQKQNLGEALKLYRDAIIVLDDVQPRSRYDTNIIDGYLNIGDILLFQTDREGALTEYKRAAAIARDAVAANPTSVTRQGRLAMAYHKIGDLLAEQTPPSEASHQYQQALEIATALAAKFPKNGEWPALAESLKAKIQALRSKP